MEFTKIKINTIDDGFLEEAFEFYIVNRDIACTGRYWEAKKWTITFWQAFLQSEKKFAAVTPFQMTMTQHSFSLQNLRWKFAYDSLMTYLEQQLERQYLRQRTREYRQNSAVILTKNSVLSVLQSMEKWTALKKIWLQQLLLSAGHAHDYQPSSIEQILGKIATIREPLKRNSIDPFDIALDESNLTHYSSDEQIQAISLSIAYANSVVDSMRESKNFHTA